MELVHLISKVEVIALAFILHYILSICLVLRWFFLCFRLVYAKHFLVMDKHLVWETFDDPIMHEGIKRCQSLLRVPFKTLSDEIKEAFTLAHEDTFQRL